MSKPKNIDEYLENYSGVVKEKLKQLRTEIKNAAPEAEEVISYGLPAFKDKAILVYFGVSKKHIGFYPTPSGISAFEEEFMKCNLKYAKGSVQFPLDKDLPLSLVKKIVQFRVEENKKK